MSIGLEAIKALIRKLTGHYRYHGLYPSTVLAQAADGTVDVLPDDEAVRGDGGLQGVKLRHGQAGFTQKVPAGARVLLGFEAGDPRKPYVALWEPGSVTETVYDNGTQAVARVGDLTQAGGVGTVVTFSPIPPAAPGPMTTGVAYLVSFSPIPPTPVLADPLYGFITTGKNEFKS